MASVYDKFGNGFKDILNSTPNSRHWNKFQWNEKQRRWKAATQVNWPEEYVKKAHTLASKEIDDRCTSSRTEFVITDKIKNLAA